MADFHVVAYVQNDRQVTMHRSGTHPDFANSAYHERIRVNDQLTVVIWWRERLRPSEEHKHNQQIVESIKADFERRR